MTAAGPGRPANDLRAPQEDNAALLEPPLSAVPGILAANRASRRAYDYDVQGRALSDLTAQARSELLAEAVRYTSAYRDVTSQRASLDSQSDPCILLSGHQPQLFHPGVWFKNFVLSGLARKNQAVAINLVIDNDTLKAASIRVPGGSIESPTAGAIEFDLARPEVPFEERRIADRDVFGSFGQRAAEEIAPLVPAPWVRAFWPRVLLRSRESDNLGECLCQARHQVEGEMGLATLELPQGRACALGAFHWFAAHLLAQLPRFREVYNAAVAEYRKAHRIRSANHPVPDLAAEGQWLEAPFWVWSSADPRRRRLFARSGGRDTLLSDLGGFQTRLPLSSDGDGAPAVEALIALEAGGIKLRTRALTTTLWARLVLGDLFIHGIGGAKYDALTDALIERFFGLAPPAFLTASATLRLPISHERVSDADLLDVRHQLRELTFHPERRLVHPSAEDRPLIARKQSWIEREQTRANAFERCRAIRAANEAMQPRIAEERARLEQSRAALADRLRASAILDSREYAFCLHPEKTLFDCLLDISPRTT